MIDIAFYFPFIWLVLWAIIPYFYILYTDSKNVQRNFIQNPEENNKVHEKEKITYHFKKLNQ